MASIPCLKSENRCTPCAGDSSNPFANLSIEPFDRNIWLGVYFGRPVNVTPNTWTTDACVGFCESAISQTDADDCARRRAEECVPIDPPFDPPPPEPPISPTLFCNQEVSCVSGSNCYTLPACTVFAGSQAEANAIAQSLCNSRVLDPALSSPCSGLPPEPPVEPVVPCPAESGVAAPESLEITSETTWLAAKTINDPAWVVEGDDLRVDTFDLPPGRYLIYNLDGHVRFVTTNPEISCQDGIYLLYVYLIDAESTIISGSVWTGIPCPQPADEDAIRVTGNAFKLSAFESEFTLNERLNGTGKCRFETTFCEAIGCGGDPSYTPSPPQVFSLIQPTGLIPQPRKVRISGYTPSTFTDPAGAAGWNGAFNTRDFYTAVGLRWTEAGVGSFGGAQVEYTMSHPTSASGRGWMLEIYSAGFVLMWRGYKAVGNTSIGRYYKDSTATPIGPACLVCADASDDVWYPGEAPP